MQNLILGIIDNYKLSDIRPFLRSVKEVATTDHVCLFTGPNINLSTEKKIRDLGIETIRYKQDFPFVSKPHHNNFKSLPHPIHIYNFRHFLYYDYLLKNGDRFHNVLITDVKDVIFQSNPFAFNVEDKLYVAVENTSIPIGACACTSKWIRRGYGDVMAEEMKAKEVICAGTTLAPTALMKKYLHRLIEEFSVVKNAFKCADQAMHNVLIHRNVIGPVFKCYNFQGPILTVGTESTYSLNHEKKLVNENNSVIPIVHQYDRHEELVRLFRKPDSPLSRIRTYFQRAIFLHHSAKAS